MAASVRERHPEIGLLVNNAGVAGRGNFLDLAPERIEELDPDNYLGSVWCLLAFLPALEAAAPAHLVNVVSVAGTVAIGPYSASKHAQLAFSRSVAGSCGRAESTCTRSTRASCTRRASRRTGCMRGRFGRVVVGPDFVADRIVRAIERDRAEIFVPRWYRAPPRPGDRSRRFQTCPRAPRAALLNRYSPPPPRFEPSSEMRTCLCHGRDEIAHAARSGSLLASDELERFLARRDLARRAFLFDELEQPADLRARRQAQLVASEQRLGRVVLASLPHRLGVLRAPDEDQRIERPRLGRPPKAVDRARRSVPGPLAREATPARSA